jgi:hypothetical protein
MKYWSKIGILTALIVSFFLGSGNVFLAQQRENDLLIGITEATIDQISEGLTHVLFSWTSARGGDLMTTQQRVHLALNILEGPLGPNYNEAYGGFQEGFGDGIGAIPHANRLMAEIIKLNQNPESIDYIPAASSVIDFLGYAVDHLIITLEMIDAESPQPLLIIDEIRTVQALLMAARGAEEERDRPTEGSARAILAWLIVQQSASP